MYFIHILELSLQYPNLRWRHGALIYSGLLGNDAVTRQSNFADCSQLVASIMTPSDAIHMESTANVLVYSGDFINSNPRITQVGDEECIGLRLNSDWVPEDRASVSSQDHEIKPN